MASKGLVFSGMRPSGRLHIGNWIGALQNWVDLQTDYDCIYSAVDVHTLTTITDGRETKEIQKTFLKWFSTG